MSWRINFTDIQGRNIRIDISGAGESASNVPTVLTASSEPLVTEIDRDEDMMKPSRLSSGYISVINEGNLSGLMPTNDMEHSVKIYSDGELAWQGYMQSENYGRDMYLEKEEAKFAISDALYSLGAVDMEDMDASAFALLIMELLVMVSITVLGCTCCTPPTALRLYMRRVEPYS